MVDTNKACKPSHCWILLVGLGSLVWTWLKTICFYYDLGFGEQQLISNSQVITSSSQTPHDFPKQILLNPTPRRPLAAFAFHDALAGLPPLLHLLNPVQKGGRWKVLVTTSQAEGIVELMTALSQIPYLPQVLLLAVKVRKRLQGGLAKATRVGVVSIVVTGLQNYLYEV